VFRTNEPSYFGGPDFPAAAGAELNRLDADQASVRSADPITIDSNDR
jgi:hypothetical protein